MIRAYTDGSSRGNPGPGGWGFMIEGPTPALPTSEGENADTLASPMRGEVRRGGNTERGGYEPTTTNNKMELQAVIEAFKYLIKEKITEDTIEIYTDSEYVIKGLTIWLDGWVRRGWMTAAKKPVLNQEYWKELSNLKFALEQMKNVVHMRYVPGHAGVAGNERVDAIATTCAIEQREHKEN